MGSYFFPPPPPNMGRGQPLEKLKYVGYGWSVNNPLPMTGMRDIDFLDNLLSLWIPPPPSPNLGSGQPLEYLGKRNANTFTGALPLVATIVTSPISNITSTTASAGGWVTGDGGSAVTARGVCWDTSINPTTANSKTTDGTGLGVFTSSITGLTDPNKYYVRAYATNGVGTSYGVNVTFIAGTTQIGGRPYSFVNVMPASFLNTSGHTPTSGATYVAAIYWLAPQAAGNGITITDGAGTVLIQYTAQSGIVTQGYYLQVFNPPVRWRDFQITQLDSGVLYLYTR